jgi:thymidylate kinase
MKQGKFIVFEGLDGSGKTTQLERLGARLTEKLGTNAVYCTRGTAPRGYCVNSSAKKSWPWRRRQ